MMRADTAARAGVVCIALGSVVWAAIPMARHMAGLVVLETRPVAALSVVQSEGAPDLTAIFTLAPFGRIPVEAQPSEQGISDLPDIVLRGIFAARDADSTALLDVDGEPGLYRVAMQVADRLDVVRITPDMVELANGARKITLRFATDAEVENAPNVVEGPSLHERMSNDLVVPAIYEKPDRPETTAEYIDYWRHRVRKNPRAVLDEIGLQPTDQGYVIADTHDVGVRLAGFRSGDLVRTVNGRAVGDPETDRRFYDDIAAAGQARIEVERGGQLLSFSFPLR
ncbi:MAG: type II secretion system protein N [Pseudomonadota bacterium]